MLNVCTRRIAASSVREPVCAVWFDGAMTEPHIPINRVNAAAVMAAPVVLLASTVAYVLRDGLGKDAAGAAIQVYSAAAFAIALLTLTGLLSKFSPRLSAVLTVTGAIGAVGVAGWAIDSLVASYAPAAAVSEHDDSIAAQFAMFMPGVIFPLTMFVLGIALAKTGAVRRGYGLTVALGAACFPVSRIGNVEALALVADALLVAGLVPIGWSLWAA